MNNIRYSHSQPPFIEECLLRKKYASFPIKRDAGYIGYLTDSESEGGEGVEGGEGGEGGGGVLLGMVRDNRRVLLGSDCDFTMTLFVMVVVVIVMVVFMASVSVVIGPAIIKEQ
jgi:hypothetical protein